MQGNKVTWVNWQVGLLWLTNAGIALPLVWPRHHLPIASFYSEFLAALACLVFALIYLYQSNSASSRFVLPRSLLIPGSLAGIVLLQLLLGYYAYTAHALMVFAYLGLASISMWIGRNIADQHGVSSGVKLVLPGLIFAGLINLLAAFLQKNGLHNSLQNWVVPLSLASGAGVYGNLAQQNHFADLLALSCLACLYWEPRQTRAHILKHIFCWCFLFGLICSGARSAWLYFILILGYAAPTSMRHINWSRQRKLVAGILLVLIVIGLLFSLPAHHWQRYVNFQETLGARGFLWKYALAISFNYPWLGVGFEGFAYQLIRLLPDNGQAAVWGIDQYPHNLLLQLAANAGLPFLVLLLALLWQYAKNLHLQRRRRGRYLVMCMLCVIAWHSFIEQPLMYLYFLLPISFLWGLCDKNIVQRYKPGSCKLVLSKVKPIAGAVLVIAMGASIMVARDYAQVEMLTQDPEQLKNQASAAYLNELSLIQQWRKRHSYPGILDALYPQASVRDDATVQAKLELNLRLLRYAPVADVIYRHAALYAQSGESERAEHYLRMAMLAYPGDVPNYTHRIRQFCADGVNWYCVLNQQIDARLQTPVQP